MNQTELKYKLSAPFDFDEWKNILAQMFPKIDYLAKATTIDSDLVKTGGQVGTIRLDDGRSLGLFKFEVADSIVIARNRRGLRDIAIRYVDQDIIHGALVFYYSESQVDYRLTYISKQTYFDSDGTLRTQSTAPKRYTFLLGENEPCTTAARRLYELISKKNSGSVYLADVTEAFSVERLNKEFFNGYKAQYAKFLQPLSNIKQNRDYVKKLLGRLVFLQFLQKKGWMGVPADSKGWEGGNKNYLKELIDKYEGNDRLLSDVLETLFFETLNEKRENDIADNILGENIKIPYLNGGLFDKDNIDTLDIDFPYSYFKDLMDFFAMYNFTIDENDPDDSEIGIDPEMLGHIFENLLEDNKDKGAFYTPKEIVQYMSKESIAQYLKTHTDESLHKAIETLIRDGVVDISLQKKDIAKPIDKLLQNVKVCDPAIGSGAFPMGVLNVLFHTRQLIYGFTKANEDFSPEKVKREIIQNNIFGVDIEQGAVDIARLRFWLALVVDGKEPKPLPNLDYKIVCGNSLLNRYNLDEPLVDVFKKYNENQDEDNQITLEKYKEMVSNYTNTSDHIIKTQFRETINGIKGVFFSELSNRERAKLIRLRKKICDLEAPSLFGRTKQEETILKSLKSTLRELEAEETAVKNNVLFENAFEWRFEFPQLLDNDGEFVGFDIVIGNPPYNELRDLDTIMQNALKLSRFYESAKGGRLNMYQFFYPLSIYIGASDGIISLITQNSILAEESALGNRRALFSETDILKIDSFPERDNKNLRVFESAKMSVCICTLRKNKNALYSNQFMVNVWKSRKMSDKHSLTISKDDIIEMYPENLIIPITSNERLAILKEIRSKQGYEIHASAGEIDMTKFKDIFTLSKEGVRVITGAQVQRYYITDTPSQGDVIYINEANMPNFSLKRQKEITNPRIILQRITGVDSKIRIIATYTKKPVLCANSTNYISKDDNMNMLYLLAILNSTLINFYVKQTSTNTNITAKVLNSLPICVKVDKLVQKQIAELVEYVFVLKSCEDLSAIVSNNSISNYFEKIIDGCVYELYFSQHMKELEIDIIDSVKKIIKPISNLSSDAEKQKTIWETFLEIKKTDNPIRDRLDLFTLRSPEILKTVIES